MRRVSDERMAEIVAEMDRQPMRISSITIGAEWDTPRVVMPLREIMDDLSDERALSAKLAAACEAAARDIELYPWSAHQAPSGKFWANNLRAALAEYREATK